MWISEGWCPSLILWACYCDALCVHGCMCVCVCVELSSQLVNKWIVKRTLTRSLSSTSLLSHTCHTVKYTYLKCTTWYVLTYICTYPSIILIKILNISITLRSFSLPIVIPSICPSNFIPDNHWFSLSL